MKHSFTIKQIAIKAGLSIATVDRVLNNRGSVRASTRNDVYSALADLERQRSGARVIGQSLVVDIVLQRSPESVAVIRKALKEQLPSLQPSVIRFVFMCWMRRLILRRRPQFCVGYLLERRMGLSSMPRLIR